jgi:nucleotide-binding universal stress UspA family protein
MVVQRGTPAESIAEFASTAQVDRLVMSMHGTTGTSPVQHTLGSTAWKILQDAPCPVLLMTVHRPVAQASSSRVAHLLP